MDSQYMSKQSELSPGYRCILMDWLVEVHSTFGLLPETLYLAANIVDRYASSEEVKLRELQLVGLTGLFVAAKYEEEYVLPPRKWIYLTGAPYTGSDLLGMEKRICNTLYFCFSRPTCFSFMEYLLEITEAGGTVRNLAYFYSELSIQEYEMLKYRPSLIAATTVYLALKNPDIKETGKYDSRETRNAVHALLHCTRLRVDKIKEVANLLQVKYKHKLEVVPRRILNAVRTKYESDSLDRVSDFTLPMVRHIDSTY